MYPAYTRLGSTRLCSTTIGTTLSMPRERQLLPTAVETPSLQFFAPSLLLKRSWLFVHSTVFGVAGL